MKKFMMALVCLMTMVMLTSCGNINEDVMKASEQLEMFSKQCAFDHSEKDTEYMFETIIVKKKRVEKDLVGEVERDAELICAKCFDPVFEKYGEKKTLDALNIYASTQSYKSIEITSKKEFYDAVVVSIVANYSKILKSKVDLKIAEYKAEMLSKRL